MKLPVISCLAAILLCGCTTVETSRTGGHHMVLIKNSGWNLFCDIPIASGNVKKPNMNTTVFFRDTVNLDNNIAILDETVKNSGARGYKNITNTIKDENVFLILLTRRIYHTSAELVFDNALSN
jgi:hypothetical protein